VLISGCRWTKFTPPFTPLKKMKVGIQNKEGRLILVWNDGKRRTMAIGLPDTPPARALAEKTKAEIEWDWHIKQYDPTLLKYKPRTFGRNGTEISVPELFDRYTQQRAKTKAKRLSQSSIDTRYKPMKRMLEKYLNIPANEVGKRQTERFADICDDNLTAGTAKARFWLMASCWDWAQGQYHVSEENPFRGFNDRFEPSSEKQRPKPFTIREIELILNGFKGSAYYAHYLDYVAFLLGVGCRIGEAAGLRWQHVADDCESVHFCRSITRGQEGPTKTKKERTVNLSPVITAMLKARKVAQQPQPNDLVFFTPTGLPINDLNFRRRAWTQVLKAAGVVYRKPYTCRSTALSHALAKGEDYISVAKAAGHSPKVLHDNYAEVIERRSVINTLELIQSVYLGDDDHE
jgi:integrase